MYYPCRENKGADQLRGYREADLRLCFRICKKPVFSKRGSFDIFIINGNLQYDLSLVLKKELTRENLVLLVLHTSSHSVDSSVQLASGTRCLIGAAS